MKEMSYRDKMVILIISIVVILVAGFFALIKPTYDKLVADTAVYESTKTEWDGIKQKLDAIDGLKKGITDTYNKAKTDAAVLENTAFGEVDTDYNTSQVNYGLDQYIQTALDENELKVSSFVVGGTSDSSIAYYYYTPNVVTYALLESADVNGNFASEITDLLETDTILSEREVASVMTNNITLEVTGKRENLMTFLDTIKDDANSINVTSVDIKDYAFSGGTTREVVGEDGQVTTVKNPNADGDSALAISMNFYNAKEIDNPDLGD